MTLSEISDYIFLPQDTDLHGDVAFVFGTWHAWQESVRKAADLYNQGLVPKVIFSGGKNNEDGIDESTAMSEEGIQLGIKPDDVLVKNQSMNTLENVLFSKKVLEKEIGLETYVRLLQW